MISPSKAIRNSSAVSTLEEISIYTKFRCLQQSREFLRRASSRIYSNISVKKCREIEKYMIHIHL